RAGRGGRTRAGSAAPPVTGGAGTVGAAPTGTNLGGDCRDAGRQPRRPAHADGPRRRPHHPTTGPGRGHAMTSRQPPETPAAEDSSRPSRPEQPLLRRLADEQRRRWQQGERVLVEAYLHDYPQLTGDPEGVLDLVYHEVVLREEAGELPGRDE